MKFRSLSKVGILSLILPLAAVAAEAKSDAKPAVPANAKSEAKPAVPAEAKAVPAAFREIAMAIPKHGKLILKVPAAWKQEFQQPYPSLPPTLILSPEQGDAFKFMLTRSGARRRIPASTIRLR